MNLEYKTVDAEVKSVDEKGEGVLRFIRFHQEDKDSDITFPGFVQNQEAILISAHNWRSDYPPLGRGTSFEADGATNFSFKLNLADERARSWHTWLTLDRQFKNPLQQVSYGFEPYPDAVERWQKNGKSGRYLKPRPDGSPGALLREISFVTLGSGNDTAVVDLKSASPTLPTRRSWPGGLTRMKGPKEHVTEAVTSTMAGLRHLRHVQRLMAKSSIAAKVDDDFDTAMEHFESVLDLLNETSLALIDPPPVTVSVPPPAPPPKAADALPEIPPHVSDEDIADAAAEGARTGEEKGDKDSVKNWVDATVEEVARLSTTLENIKRKRAAESDRYPNGRPMSPERLEQVERLIARLAQLKAFGQEEVKQTQEQQELQEMAKRLKRLGVAV